MIFILAPFQDTLRCRTICIFPRSVFFPSLHFRFQQHGDGTGGVIRKWNREDCDRRWDHEHFSAQDPDGHQPRPRGVGADGVSQKQLEKRRGRCQPGTATGGPEFSRSWPSRSGGRGTGVEPVRIFHSLLRIVDEGNIRLAARGTQIIRFSPGI